MEGKRKGKKIGLIIAIVLGVLLLCSIALSIVVLIFGIPYIEYRETMKMMEDGKYEEAIVAFAEQGDYLESETLLEECKYLLAKKTMEESKYDEAIEMFRKLDKYKDCKSLITECQYLQAEEVLSEKDYQKALEQFEELEDYKKSEEKVLECKYYIAVNMIEEGKIVDAYKQLEALGAYKDCVTLRASIQETYQLILTKPKIFVNRMWNERHGTRVWIDIKAINENTLQINIEGSAGADDHSTENLIGEWDESIGKVRFKGSAYRTTMGSTYCTDSNVSGVLYYKGGFLRISYDDPDKAYCEEYLFY